MMLYDWIEVSLSSCPLYYGKAPSATELNPHQPYIVVRLNPLFSLYFSDSHSVNMADGAPHCWSKRELETCGFSFINDFEGSQRVPTGIQGREGSHHGDGKQVLCHPKQAARRPARQSPYDGARRTHHGDDGYFIVMGQKYK